MSLRIDIPSRKYIANDPVAGTVTLTGSEDVGVARISITFSGRCKSRIVVSRGNNGSSTYRGRVPLFTYTQTLFTGPHTLHPNEHSWPFTFRFPARCETRGADRFQGPKVRFNDDPNQELPRSFTLMERGWNQRKSGYVSYQLEATLVRDGTKIFASHSTSTTRPLQLIKPRKTAEPGAQMFGQSKPYTCQSLHLLPGYEERSLTFKERLSSMRSKNVPVAAFDVKLQMPKVAVLGQALPLFLSIEHKVEKSTAPASPTVYLKSISVTLQSNGSIRCINDDIFNLSNTDRQEGWDDDMTIASADLKDTPTPIPANATPLDLRELMDLQLRESQGLSQGLVPSFSTFNLEIHYWLRVKVAFECAQKSFKTEFFSGNFVLLAGEWVGAEMSNGVSTEFAAAPTYHEGGTEPLPPYARNPELWNPSAIKG